MVVIIGGLFTSTLLNLFFMPAFYLRFMGEASGVARVEKPAPAIADR